MSGIVEAVTRPEVWLMRHGETAWSAAGRHTGRTDVPLTSAGCAAAKRIGQLVASQSFAAVFTSPLGRARETCELAGLAGGSVIDDDLREWDYGDYEGLTTAEIRETRPDWTVWRDGCPGGEVTADVGARVDRVVARLRERDGVLAVFGHGHCLRVLAARWVGLVAEDGARIALDTATVSRLGWEREQPVIRTWNVQP
jgi:probable phosphoglycerate mutase